MFTSLKQVIEARLGYGLINSEVIYDNCFFINVVNQQINNLLKFLKNDPDINLTALDNIYVISENYLPFKKNDKKSIIYELKSLKLPYKVTLVIDINNNDEINSISNHFIGASWLEMDLSLKHGLNIVEG